MQWRQGAHDYSSVAFPGGFDKEEIDKRWDEHDGMLSSVSHRIIYIHGYLRRCQISFELLRSRGELITMEYALMDINSKHVRPNSKKDLPKMFDDDESLKKFFPSAVMTDLAKLASDLFALMGKSRDSPRDILIPALHLINSTNWKWTTSKNTKRDWTPIVQAVAIEQLFYPLYRDDLLKTSAARTLRLGLKTIMDGHIRAMRRIVINGKSGKMTAPIVHDYWFPDLIQVDSSVPCEKIDTLGLLKRLGKHERRLEAQKSVARVIRTLESSPYSHVEGNEKNPVTAKMSTLINAILIVSQIVIFIFISESYDIVLRK
jgi:hypothetical protein